MEALSPSFLCLQTVCDQVWPDRSKLFETLTVFLIFFHIHFLETKARLVWAFVVRMYQRRISRDKEHIILKKSELNVKVYTFVFPFVRSSILCSLGC